MKHFFLASFFLLVCYNLSSQTFEGLYKSYTSQQEQGEFQKARETGFELVKKFPKELSQSPLRYADVCNSIGHHYFENNLFDSAYANYSRAVNLVYSVKADTSFDYAFYLQNAAFTLAQAGSYQLAEKYFLVSLPRLANFLGASSFEYTVFYKQYVDMKIDMGDYEAAKPLNDALLHYFKTIKGENDTYYLNCLNNKARIYQGEADYANAAKLFLQILDAQTKYNSGDLKNIATAYNNAAECYRQMGNYEVAEPYYLKAYEIDQQLEKGYSTDKASVLNNLGLLYKAKSDYRKAEKCFLQSIENYQGTHYQNTVEFANPLNNAGDMYRMMGNYKKAIQYCSYAAELRKTLNGESHEYYANAITNVALIYMDFNYLSEAEELLLKAEKIYKERLGENHVRYANALNNLSSLYLRKKDYPKALIYKQLCLNLMEKNGAAQTDKYALYLDGKAAVLLRLKKYNEAIATCQKAADIFKTHFGKQNYNYVDMQYNMAYINEQAGNSQAARYYYLQSMQAYEKIIRDNFVSMSEDEKFGFYRSISGRFESFYHFALKYQKAFAKDDSLLLSLFKVRLTDKSLLLNESNRVYKTLTNSKDTSIQRIFTNWLNQKKYLQQLYKYSNEELSKDAINMDYEEEIKNSLEKELHEKAIGFRQLSKNDVSPAQLAKQLKQGELAIEIIRTAIVDDQEKEDVLYGAMVIGKDFNIPQLIRLDSCQHFDSLFIDHYKLSIQRQDTDRLSYQRFFKPFEKYLKEIHTIYFSADGVYQKLNLYTLYNPTLKKYLLESTEINQVSSLKDLLNKHETNVVSKSISLFGFPEYDLTATAKGSQKELPEALSTRFGFAEFPELPGTKKETEEIAALFQQQAWKTHLYLTNIATEQEIKKLIQPTILHIATHGFFLPDEDIEDEKTLGFSSEKARENPLLRSGLIMAGASSYARDSVFSSPEDGILTAYEASLLNLQTTELVTLSACETGLGDLVNGQGVYGLQRAFLTAGAKSVLMSLWEVDDAATQDLMIAFYKDWLKNYSYGNKKTSLRKAQLAVKEKYPHPLYWGAFVMIGN